MKKGLNSTKTLENSNYKICIFYLCKTVKQQNKTNKARQKTENGKQQQK